jgi:hypothetical protein
METESGDHPLSFKMDDRDCFFGDESSSKQPTLFTAEVKGNLEVRLDSLSSFFEC